MIRAWRYAGGGRLAPRELPDPALEGDQVLVAVEAAVIGGPELWAETDDEAAPTPGGAAVGRVVAAGEGAEASGDRVLVGPHLPCGDCELCRRGVAVLCPEGKTLGRDTDGALASHVVSRARWICRLEGELKVPGAPAALLAREAAEAYAMYARAGVAPGEPVVVVGDDAIATLLCEVGRAKGTRPLAVRESEEPAAARERAREAGFGARPWKVFATSTGAAGRALALALAGPGTTVTLRAGGPEPAPPPVDLAGAVDRAVSILGVAGAHPDLLPEVAALAVRGELDPAAVAEVIPADRIETALEHAADARARGKVCVVTL